MFRYRALSRCIMSRLGGSSQSGLPAQWNNAGEAEISGLAHRPAGLTSPVKAPSSSKRRFRAPRGRRARCMPVMPVLSVMHPPGPAGRGAQADGHRETRAPRDAGGAGRTAGLSQRGPVWSSRPPHGPGRSRSHGNGKGRGAAGTPEALMRQVGGDRQHRHGLASGTGRTDAQPGNLTVEADLRLRLSPAWCKWNPGPLGRRPMRPTRTFRAGRSKPGRRLPFASGGASVGSAFDSEG